MAAAVLVVLAALLRTVRSRLLSVAGALLQLLMAAMSHLEGGIATCRGGQVPVAHDGPTMYVLLRPATG